MCHCCSRLHGRPHLEHIHIKNWWFLLLFYSIFFESIMKYFLFLILKKQKYMSLYSGVLNMVVVYCNLNTNKKSIFFNLTYNAIVGEIYKKILFKLFVNFRKVGFFSSAIFIAFSFSCWQQSSDVPLFYLLKHFLFDNFVSTYKSWWRLAFIKLYNIYSFEAMFDHRSENLFFIINLISNF